MRQLSFPTLLAGLVAVLVGYASSAAIIWQAAAAAGASAQQIAGWMTALGIAMGVSTLGLSLWYRAPVLTAWSTPGAALLATSLHGVTMNEAIGVFIFASALIVLCGVTGLFARLMKLIPHSLAAAMLAGILLRFGLDAFATLPANALLCGVMLIAWLIAKAIAPRYAIVATLVAGLAICLVTGQFHPSQADITPFTRHRSAVFPGDHGVAKCARRSNVKGVGLSGAGVAADDGDRVNCAGDGTFWRVLGVYRRNHGDDLPEPGRASRQA